MQIPLLQVDAFTDRLFGGNPAAVCLLVDWPQDSVLQSIAAENNLSETAFVMPVPGRYQLRWFTPTVEVDLCGHATLASAHVLFNRIETEATEIEFETRSGILQVTRNEERLTMDFPAVLASRLNEDEAGAKTIEDVIEAMGGPTPVEIHTIRKVHGADYKMLVYEHVSDVELLAPDFRGLKSNVIATARNPAKDDSDPNEPDFVSRFFAPCSGVDEDPVTGSAHCTLGPYWAGRLGKSVVVGRQISRRGGTVWCELGEDRVLLSGQCVYYFEGTITVLDPSASAAAREA